MLNVNGEVFKMMIRKNKDLKLETHTLCDCKCKFDCTTCNSDQKYEIMIISNANGKSIVRAKKVVAGILTYICICENSRYLKRVVDDLVIVCNEIKSVTDSVSTNGTNIYQQMSAVLCQ